MRVAIRADSSAEIGLGHVVRTLALAQEFRRREADVVFITRDNPGSGIGMLEAAGIPVLTLNEAENSGATDWVADLHETTTLLNGYQPDVVVVDSYQLPHEWESGIRALGVRLLALDDVPARMHDCDVLLDQNPGPGIEREYRALVPESCEVLVGPEYALVRNEFRHIREQGFSRESRRPRSVLVFMGGGSVDGLVSRVLAEIAPIVDEEDLQLDVVLGPSRAGGESSDDPHTRHGIPVARSVSDMADRMAAADVALGSAGSASWERCCLGLPAIVVAVADNQLRIGSELESSGAAEYLGVAAKVSENAWADSLRSLLRSPDRLDEMTRAGLALVDGRGAARVADAILGRVAR